MLAMLYVILFSTLSVGFFAAFTLATQTSYNEREAGRALAAAESGMEFARYQLWAMNIEYSSSLADLLDRVEADLEAALNGSANLKGGNISRVGDTIFIPGSTSQYITANGSGEEFRLEITRDGTNLVVTSYGRSATGVSAAGRGVRLRYAMMQRPSSIFNFGVASRGPISMDSNARVVGSPDPSHGSILSTSTASTPVSVQGNSSVSGDVSISSSTGTVSVGSSASIAGSTNTTIKAQHIHKGVQEPEFPTIDTDIYKKFATNVVSTPGAKFDTVNVKNLYIKANTNPTFAGNIKVQGVIYVETPNKVYFDSNVEVTGAIVTQNNPTGSLSQNVIEMESNVKLRGVEHLPATADFPPELRELTGSTILAPGFHLYLDSNFGGECGSIVASSIHFDSNAAGTLNGSVINLGPGKVWMDSNATATIANPGDAFAPAGMYFGSRYVPLPGSYEEVLP